MQYVDATGGVDATAVFGSPFKAHRNKAKSVSRSIYSVVKVWPDLPPSTVQPSCNGAGVPKQGNTAGGICGAVKLSAWQSPDGIEQLITEGIPVPYHVVPLSVGPFDHIGYGYG